MFARFGNVYPSFEMSIFSVVKMNQLLVKEKRPCCYTSTKGLRNNTYFLVASHWWSFFSFLVQLQVLASISISVSISLLQTSSSHLLFFGCLKKFLEGIIVVQFAEEVFLRKKLSIVQLFWIIESFIWKISRCFWSLARFQERIKAGSSSQKISYI